MEMKIFACKNKVKNSFIKRFKNKNKNRNRNKKWNIVPSYNLVIKEIQYKNSILAKALTASTTQ